MQPFYYAQINSASICYAVTQTAGEITQSDMIPVDSYDTTLLGKEWTESGWVEPAPLIEVS